jgi:flagellar M-ring protein FliF
MTDQIKKTLSGAKNGWEKIDRKKKTGIVIIVALMLIGGILMNVMWSNVDYAVLFTNLELTDAGHITNDLDARRISYKIEDHGRTILIDKSLVDSYRMELAVNDMLPRSTTGFEIFDNIGLMVTDKDRDIMYQRALAGELQRTISSLEGINSAMVHLVMSKKSIFDTEANSASASVVVDLKPGHKMTESAVKGIASLVSGAVENMPMENIRIVDSRGTLLSGTLQNEGGNPGNSLSRQHEERTTFERELENKILNLLGSVFGHEKVKVSVLTELDFNAEEVTTVTYSNPVIRSEQVSASGGDLDYLQVTGGLIDDNISNVVQGQEGSHSSYSRIANNEISSETRHIIKAPGRVNRITASVVFDGILTEAQRFDIHNVVEAIIGYDWERGDLINVVGLTHADRFTGQETPIPEEVSLFKQYRTFIFAGIGVLLLILLSVVILIMRKKNSEEEEFIPQMNRKNGVDGMASDDEAPYLKVNRSKNDERAKKFAVENPEVVAKVIKTWLKEGQT